MTELDYRHCSLDDVPNDHIVWLPAHTALHRVGKAELSNGQTLSHLDRIMNARADELAKEAVEEHRVPLRIRQAVQAREEEVEYVEDCNNLEVVDI